jgi:tetratricopeptide (TPR) repeat protein
VLILQIKQAECALADGRLDEACQLVAGKDRRSHRRGQVLVGRLVQRLIERGREHLAAGHTREALADCQKAMELGGNLSEAAELQRQVAETLSQQRRGQRRRGDLGTTAREHIENGRLSLGEQLLADAAADSVRVGLLRHEAAARRSAAEAALKRAEAALKRSDYPGAIQELLTARAQRADDEEMADLTARVVCASADWARQEMLQGRVDLAASLLGRLKLLAGESRDCQDLLHAAGECRRGWAAVCRGELRRAGEILRRARTILPRAKWLEEAIASADRGAEAMETLRSGPLGLLGSGEPEPHEPPADEAVTLPSGAEPPPVLLPVEPQPAGSASLLPQRFLLQVDGAGSSVVLRDSQVTVGPISSSGRPEVGLLADPSLPIVTIERTEGDYFLRCEAPIDVNDRMVTGKLLADGDRIALSPRCRMRFRLPNAASSSAVLELSTARLPQADVRRVVLLDREMVMGPGPAAHVRADHLAERAVLYVRDGRLMCRAKSQLTVDQEPLDPAAGIPLGKCVRIGPLGLVVTRA